MAKKSATATEKPRKEKKCTACGEKYQPMNTLQKACSPSCAISLVEFTKRKEFKQKTRQMRQKLNDNDRGYQLKRAQAAFNKFIRLRDRHEPCISCGRHHEGQYQAGHYKTVGAYPELRFEELNCHKQCAPCNNHKSGDIANYRVRLAEKIGVDKVEWLEGPHGARNWTIDDLKVITKHYNTESRKLERGEGHE